MTIYALHYGDSRDSSVYRYYKNKQLATKARAEYRRNFVPSYNEAVFNKLSKESQKALTRKPNMHIVRILVETD